MADERRGSSTTTKPDAVARGREAGKPSEIPKQGWKDVALRVKAELKADNVALLAAGVAFYAFLAIFPAIIAAISIWGLVADEAQVERQIQEYATALPPEAQTLLTDAATNVAGGDTGALSLGLIISIALALWTASGGMNGLIKALNTVYDEPETRGFLKLRGLALVLTVGAIIVGLLAIGMVAILPALLGIIGLGGAAEVALRWLRWPLLGALVIVGLAVIYRLAPDRNDPQMRWVSPGAVLATILWLLGSGAFSLYVTNFGNYNETYGALAGVVILLFWLFLTGFIILLGAEVNAEMEAQTAKDTTIGDEMPMGEREAQKADNLGQPAT